MLSGLFFNELIMFLMVFALVNMNNMSDLVSCVESRQTSFL